MRVESKTRSEAWTPDRRSAQSEKMRRAVREKDPTKPWGGKVQKLTDEDIRLIHALAREREQLRLEHKEAKERAAELWDQIQSLSNLEIGKKFDVSERVVSHALVSVRGNKVA